MPHHQTALRLLDCDFPDENVRAYATKVLERVPDEQLEDFMVQLTQVCDLAMGGGRGEGRGV